MAENGSCRVAGSETGVRSCRAQAHPSWARCNGVRLVAHCPDGVCDLGAADLVSAGDAKRLQEYFAKDRVGKPGGVEKDASGWVEA